MTLKIRIKTVGEALRHLEQRAVDTKNHRKLLSLRECFKSLRGVQSKDEEKKYHDLTRHKG